MKHTSRFLRAVGVIGVAGLTLIGATMSQGTAFDVNPGNPSAHAPVRFLDRTAAGAAMAWLWTFGDGETSTLQSPTHAYQFPGSYPVTLRVTTAGGTVQSTRSVSVAQEDTLQLLTQAGNTFQVTLEATDPRTGNVGEGQAIPQNDVFGYFTIPALVPTNPGAPVVPEVFVKILDARAIGQDFWVFWGGLTDLEYTLTIRDTVRGSVKVKHNPVTDSVVCLGADTSGFANLATPTVTPTPPPSAVHTVNIGQGGNQFLDVTSGTHVTTIKVGESVQWNWMGGPHSSTAGECKDGGGYYGDVTCNDSGAWNSGSHSMPYQYPHTFTTPGSYKYFCQVHGSAMTGTVVVTSE